MPKICTPWFTTDHPFVAAIAVCLIVCPLAPKTLLATQSLEVGESIQRLRAALDPPFEATGGFSAFDCQLPSADAPPRTFTCDAVNQGNSYRYLLAPAGDELRVELVTEPAGQLTYPWLGDLEAGCRRMVEQFDRSAWSEMHQSLAPELQEVLDVPVLEARLAPMREVLGKSKGLELQSYSKRYTGRQELQYSLPSERGLASFRCGLVIDEALDETGEEIARENKPGEPKIVAFLFTPATGTELYEEMFEAKGVQLLSTALGMELSRFDIPFEHLVEPYDAAESSAWLKDGQEFRVRSERIGREDDFDDLDLGFQVLDVPLFVANYLRSQDLESIDFDCPTRVVPDGGTLSCTVDLKNGDRMSFTVARRGGDHRLLSMEKSER